MYPQRSNKKQKLEEKNKFLLVSWRSLTKRAGSGAGSASQRYGSASPDPYQNVTDPEHRLLHQKNLPYGLRPQTKLTALFWVTDTNLHTWILRKIAKEGRSNQIGKKYNCLNEKVSMLNLSFILFVTVVKCTVYMEVIQSPNRDESRLSKTTEILLNTDRLILDECVIRNCKKIKHHVYIINSFKKRSMNFPTYLAWIRP